MPVSRVPVTAGNGKQLNQTKKRSFRLLQSLIQDQGRMSVQGMFDGCQLEAPASPSASVLSIDALAGASSWYRGHFVTHD